MSISPIFVVDEDAGEYPHLTAALCVVDIVGCPIEVRHEYRGRGQMFSDIALENHDFATHNAKAYKLGVPSEYSHRLLESRSKL